MSNSRRFTDTTIAILGLTFSAAIGGCSVAADPPIAPTAAPAAAKAKPGVKPAEPVNDPKDLKITLKWSTASEVDNYGYFVYRGETEEGPFKVLNERAIPGAGNSEVPRDYRYEDRAVKMGSTYFYYLESVSTVGVKEKFSPVLERECCKVPGANEEPKDGKKSAKREPASPVRPVPAETPKSR